MEKIIKWMVPLTGINIMKVEIYEGVLIYSGSNKAVPIPENRQVFDTPREAMMAVRKNLLKSVNNAHDHYKHMEARLEEFDRNNKEMLLG